MMVSFIEFQLWIRERALPHGENAPIDAAAGTWICFGFFTTVDEAAEQAKKILGKDGHVDYVKILPVTVLDTH
jgi:hypothetical protein